MSKAKAKAKAAAPKVIPITCDPGGTLKRIPLAQLQPFQGDLKDLPKEQYRQLRASILKEGFMAPVFVWKKKILDGHQRTSVLINEGWEIEGGEVPVVEIVASSAQAAARKLLKLTSSYGKPQAEGVFDFMQAHQLDLSDFQDVELPDFNADELAALFDEGPVTTEPPMPQTPAEPVTQLGDLWELGPHRLICGDCVEPEGPVQALLLQGDHVLADPPYNIGFSYEGIEDKMKPAQYLKFCNAWFDGICAPLIKKKGGVILSPGPQNPRAYPEPRDHGVWVKPNANAGASCFYIRKCEPLLFYGDLARKRNTDLFTYNSTFPEELLKSYAAAGVIDTHPPSKSWPLWIELMGMLGDGIVVDPFSGSGTTLLAAQELGRVCYTSELEPRYVDLCIDRWQKLTGADAMLKGNTFAQVKAARDG